MEYTVYITVQQEGISEYIRNEKQRKTSFADIAHSYFAKEELQQFTVHQQLIKAFKV